MRPGYPKGQILDKGTYTGRVGHTHPTAPRQAPVTHLAGWELKTLRVARQAA